MELQKNSLYARWYKFAYLTNDLPKSLCGLFWGLVFSIPFIVFSNPIWIILKVFKRFKLNRNIDELFFIIPIVLNILMVFASFQSSKGFDILNILQVWGTVICAIIVIITLLTCAGMFIIWLSELKKPNLIIPQVLKDIKDKTCTIIKWK